MVEQSTAASHSLASEADALSNLVSHFRVGRGASQATAHEAAQGASHGATVAVQQERIAAFAARVGQGR
jgi:hypothetical protein